MGPNVGGNGEGVAVRKVNGQFPTIQQLNGTRDTEADFELVAGFTGRSQSREPVPPVPGAQAMQPDDAHHGLVAGHLGAQSLVLHQTGIVEGSGAEHLRKSLLLAPECIHIRLAADGKR